MVIKFRKYLKNIVTNTSCLSTVQILYQLYFNQFTIKQCHFTETALLKVHIHVTVNIDKGKVKQFTLLYRSAVIDTTDHTILIRSGFSSYLADIQQIVRIANRIQLIILTQFVSCKQHVGTFSVVELMVNKLHLFQMKRCMKASTST